MKIDKTYITLITLSAIALLFMIFYYQPSSNSLTIQSADVKEGKMLSIEQVFNGFGCQGANKFPQISIRNIPDNAKSLALTIYDPDAPTGSGWWHFISYNIPTSITDIAAGDNKIADGVKFGRNDYGNYQFGGACPPKGHGKHRYIFTIYALGVEKLDLPADASAALIGYNLNANAIEKASLTAIYERK
ncbi:MAG: YbhB/YbcL family Raf kinase inhibitor-like protein [Proteobacteria bacterium]|nr:YbhB/YbcL family Raf kinase inhibitor-like protein [Pseudomonadota bacterium]